MGRHARRPDPTAPEVATDMRVSRVLGGIGRVLITIGTLLLLFVAFQLWGTGLHEEQAQHKLNRQLTQLLAADAPTTTGPSTSTAPTSSTPGATPTTRPPAVVPKRDIAPDIGQVFGRISIPVLHVHKAVVQGVDLTQLDEAPGHYPQTPFPGQAGNAAIAGHRTTYGAPFSNVDKLRKGDKIVITTVQGTFTYSVQRIFIVSPGDVWVLTPDKAFPNALTLTACHPKLDASQRIIVRASLMGKPVPQLPHQAEKATEAVHSGDALALTAGGWWAPSARVPALLWGLACGGVWLLTWAASGLLGRGLKRWLPYLAGVPAFLVLLFIFFEHATKLLPPGF